MNNYGNFRNVVLLNVKIKLQGHMPEGIENCYSYAYIYKPINVHSASKDIENFPREGF